MNRSILTKSVKLTLILGCGLSAMFAVTACAAVASPPRQFGPHVHGITHLDVGVEGSTLELWLAAPGHNIVGFEHPPSTPAQKQQLTAAMALLRSPVQWFAPDIAAGCTLLDTVVEPHGYDSGDAPATAGNDHTDIDAHYRYHCRRPASLNYIDISLADFFGETRQIVVALVLPGREDQQVLLTGQHRITLVP